MTKTANAMPAKEFFLRMITRDISLEDCILDLIDNSVDGANEVAGHGDMRLEGFRVALTLEEDRFCIEDNCGGISLEEATSYAFHFGRRKGADDDGGIGVYGIGMKRAVFKLGKTISIRSSTEDESFSTTIDVLAWEQEDEWEFQLDDAGPQEQPGTRIEVTDLNDGVGQDLTDPTFENSLKRSVSRDYSIFLRAGLSVMVNGHEIPPEQFSVLVSDEFQPARLQYEDDGVNVDITAGMAAPPPDDDSAQAEIQHYERYGWYVVCNDRVVIAADKSRATVWGVDHFQNWHNQYNGFLGILSLRARDPAQLPWTTTKRDIDQTHPVYRRAVIKMQALTAEFIKYTNQRKGNTKRAEKLEAKTVATPVDQVLPRPSLAMPSIERLPKVEMANIQYKKPKEEVRRVAIALGNKRMPYTRVGERTFDYFVAREVSEEE